MNIEAMLKHGRWLFKGVMAEYAPGFIKGALIELLADVTVQEVAKWVQENYILLDRLPDKYRAQLDEFNMGDLSWLTSEWCIEAIAKKKPELASLFLGWDEGRDWLERQGEIIREEFSK